MEAVLDLTEYQQASDEEREEPASGKPSFARLSKRVLFQIFSSPEPVVALIILINLFFLYGRPQDVLPVIGIIKIPLVFSLIPLPFVLSRLPDLWFASPQIRKMFVLLAFGAAWVPFAHNNYWAFHTWRDVAAQFLCYLFPIVLFMGYGKTLRSIITLLCFISICLSTYALTHSGKGPGGFLGDENDLGLALLALLGLPLMMLPRTRAFGTRMLYGSAAALIVLAIIATSSRGTFLGLLALLLYWYLKSSTKIATLFLAALIVLAGISFAPQSYWDRMETIKRTDEGSAQERRDIWKVALKVWLYPTHIVFGTGMNNTPNWLAEFEPVINRTQNFKSVAGRAVHSSFFQLLSDLGIFGFYLIGSVIWASFSGNNRQLKRIRRFFADLDAAGAKMKQARLDAEDGTRSHLLRFSSSNEEIAVKDAFHVFQLAREELLFGSAVLSGLNTCWIGAIVAGFFISVLYYPPFWLLAVLSLAAQSHINALIKDLTLILEQLELPKEMPDEEYLAAA